jgi:hypothetical protein
VCSAPEGGVDHKPGEEDLADHGRHRISERLSAGPGDAYAPALFGFLDFGGDEEARSSRTMKREEAAMEV